MTARMVAVPELKLLPYRVGDNSVVFLRRAHAEQQSGLFNRRRLEWSRYNIPGISPCAVIRVTPSVPTAVSGWRS